MVMSSPYIGRVTKVSLVSGFGSLGPTVVRIVGDMACVKTSFATVEQMLIFERSVGGILKRSPNASDFGFVKFVS